MDTVFFNSILPFVEQPYTFVEENTSFWGVNLRFTLRDSTTDAAATTWPAPSVPKCAPLSTAAMQWTLPSRNAPSFEMVGVTAAVRATAVAGGPPTASAGGRPGI